MSNGGEGHVINLFGLFESTSESLVPVTARGSEPRWGPLRQANAWASRGSVYMLCGLLVHPCVVGTLWCTTQANGLANGLQPSSKAGEARAARGPAFKLARLVLKCEIGQDTV